MTAPTHISFAEFIYLLILTTTGVSLNVVNASVIAVASILPDIDTAASTVGRMLPFISVHLERKFGHRTLTHSITFVAALTIILFPVFFVNKELYVCFLVGYASHPFLDTMTVNGVKLFYPFSSVKCVFPFEVNNPHRYRTQTGSKMDKTLAIIFLCACVPVFIIAYIGYERFVRTTQHNIEAAVRDYDEFSKDHLVFAQIESYNSLTKQPLLGSFEIIGALNPTTLVFKGSDERPHTIGKEFQADYVVESILCSQGDPAISSIRNIDLSNLLLSQITSYVDTSAQNYFFGDLTTSDKVSLPENIKIFTPVTGSATTIKLNFATLEDLQTFNLEYVLITKGLLTIKSISTHAGRKGGGPTGSSTGASTGGSTGSSTGGSTDDALPRFENFTQISLTLDAKESIEFLKEKGDTIHEKELIARKTLAQFYEDQFTLNQDKITALLSQRQVADSQLSKKITSAEQSIRIDSSEYANNLELSKNHYISGSILEASRLKWKKECQLISGFTASRLVDREKTNIEIGKLELDIAQLKAKARAAALQSEIRSPLNGILVDIRQTLRNNKTQVTFIIRRFRQ